MEHTKVDVQKTNIHELIVEVKSPGVDETIAKIEKLVTLLKEAEELSQRLQF